MRKEPSGVAVRSSCKTDGYQGQLPRRSKETGCNLKIGKPRGTDRPPISTSPLRHLPSPRIDSTTQGPAIRIATQHLAYDPVPALVLLARLTRAKMCQRHLRPGLSLQVKPTSPFSSPCGSCRSHTPAFLSPSHWSTSTDCYIRVTQAHDWTP